MTFRSNKNYLLRKTERNRMNKKITYLVCVLVTHYIILPLSAAARAEQSLVLPAQSNFINVSSKQELLNHINNTDIVTVTIHADWCGVCKRLERNGILEALARNNPDIKVLKANEALGGIASHFNVSAYPTTIILAQGKEIDRIAGIKSLETYQASVNKARASKSSLNKEIKTSTTPTTIKKEGTNSTQTCPASASSCPVKKTIPSQQEGKVIEIDSAQQFQEILKKSQYKVVDFYTTWCGPCKALKPIFAELATQYSDVIFLSVDAERVNSVASQYGINGYPTVIILDNNNKVVFKESGFSGKESLKRKIDQAINKSSTIVIREEVVKVS